MSDRTLAVLFVVAIWWLSTGVVLKMVWLGRQSVGYSVGAATVLAVAGLVGLTIASRSETVAAAYLGFGSALAVWAWHELTFLLGLVTGPRKIACPPGAKGLRRFVLATETVIHHELALAATVAIVVALTWRAPNQVGTATFLVLWVMRLSAKLNVFLGVRNLTEQFIPDHLRYLLSYVRRARMNPLMPMSLAFAGAVAVRLGADAVRDDASSFFAIGRALVAAILALAVVEHVFLTLPVPDALLWRWAIRIKRATRRVPL